MGTRGFLTFAIDHQEKTSYIHADAYPEHQGLIVLRWLRDSAVNQVEVMYQRARELRVVEPDSVPSAWDVERLARHWRPIAGDRPPSWYSLLRGTQGDPALMLEAGVMEGARDWPCHPQARWGYLIDLDARRLEVYEGGRREPHDRGRFAGRDPFMLGGLGFRPPALIASWPFRALPSDTAFVDDCYARAEVPG